DATMYEVNVRQYTEEGTFKAFEQHLPRLKEMGIKILWFMPIYPISEKKRNGTLGSYYAIADYTGVNPEFGTKEDFRALVEKCHEMGFKVMLDWVANHTGWDNKWITEHPDWYTQDAKGNIVIPPTTNWSDVADLNYKNEDMRKAMIDAMATWVKDFDIDGFRCDYASGVPLDFWNKAREQLEAIKPLFMLAEDDKSMAFLTYSFNSNYGWSLYHSLNNIAKGTAKASSLLSYFNVNKSKYPTGTYPLHFIDNHDENSWNGTVEERLGQAQYPSLALVFTAPGMPLIYSGQEADLNKRLQFFEKDQIDWSNLKNEAFIKSLIALKKDHPALWNGQAGGDITFLETSDEQVLAFERIKDGDKLLVLLNFSKDEKTVTVKFANKVEGTTFDTQASVSYAQGDQSVTLKPWGYQIVVEK
ncbi:MAG: alpha-amylase family glycosyl hydrolase, partial [Clostridia bacterium]|nr:alpha-amylase family glycosyl hydrolase [Clostridia bacterium]